MCSILSEIDIIFMLLRELLINLYRSCTDGRLYAIS